MGTRVCLVVGGSGFLGRALVRRVRCSKEYDVVRILDIRPHEEGTATSLIRRSTAHCQRDGNAKLAPIEMVLGDLTNPSTVAQACAGVTTVFHLASIVWPYLRENVNCWRVNVEGTRTLLQGAKESGVVAFVYCSTADVVVDHARSIKFADEDDFDYPERPMHPYIATKIEAEKVVLSCDTSATTGSERMRTCSIRPVHLYGPDDPHAIVQSVKAMSNGPMRWFNLGEGASTFDIVHVENVSHCLQLADVALRNNPEKVGGEAFFVNEDNAPNYFEFIRPYADQKGLPKPLYSIPTWVVFFIAWVMEMLHRVLRAFHPKMTWEPEINLFIAHCLLVDWSFRSDKARRVLGYRPVLSPAAALKDTLEWFETVQV